MKLISLPCRDANTRLIYLLARRRRGGRGRGIINNRDPETLLFEV